MSKREFDAEYLEISEKAVQFAASRGHKAVVQYLFSREAEYNPIETLNAVKDPEIGKLIIRESIAVYDCPDLLFEAVCKRCDLTRVKWFLDVMAVKEDWNHSNILVAATKGGYETTKFILDMRLNFDKMKCSTKILELIVGPPYNIDLPPAMARKAFQTADNVEVAKFYADKCDGEYHLKPNAAVTSLEMAEYLFTLDGVDKKHLFECIYRGQNPDIIKAFFDPSVYTAQMTKPEIIDLFIPHLTLRQLTDLYVSACKRNNYALVLHTLENTNVDPDNEEAIREVSNYRHHSTLNAK